MYQFVCYGNSLHLFFQSFSCFCRAYNKHPELSSSWLFYLPSFLPRAAAAQPSLRRCHCRVVGLGPPKVGVVGAVPDSLPQTQGQTFLGEAKSQRPEGWRGMVESEADGTKGPMSPGTGSTSVVAEAVATHTKARGTWCRFLQLWAAPGTSCLHPTPLDSDPWTHPPSQSTLQALQALVWGWSLLWAMVGWACPYLGPSRKESNVSPISQEHTGKAQDFTGPVQPCDEVPRTKKSWVSATAEVAGEPQSSNSTIIYCTGCIKLKQLSHRPRHHPLKFCAASELRDDVLSDKHTGMRAWHCSCRWVLFISLNQYHNIQTNNFPICFPEFPSPQYLSLQKHKERREGCEQGWMWKRCPWPRVCRVNGLYLNSVHAGWHARGLKGCIPSGIKMC